jgi:hypothetical protein
MLIDQIKKMKKVSIIHIALLLLGISFCCVSCKKDKDYRNKFEGTYICDYMKVSQSQVILPDTILYFYDTSSSLNVPFTVVKAEDSRKLVILGIDMEVYEDGSLQYYWVPGREITGGFHNDDSISISQGIGKTDGYIEYWWGKK